MPRRPDQLFTYGAATAHKERDSIDLYKECRVAVTSANAKLSRRFCTRQIIKPTVDFRTIGGNAKALLGYPTTHQILVAEEVSSECCVVSAVVLM